jgi:hypothetical protein
MLNLNIFDLDLRQVSSTNKSDRYDIAEIFFKVALNTITAAHYEFI